MDASLSAVTPLQVLKFRGAELVDGPARHLRRQIDEGTSEPLIEIAHDARAARSELRESEKDADGNEEREDGEAACSNGLQHASNEP